MILGYILICGMGPFQPNAIEGCHAITVQFESLTECQEAYAVFANESYKLKEGHYIEGHDCLVFGSDL
jgi:hypothetical protein